MFNKVLKVLEYPIIEIDYSVGERTGVKLFGKTMVDVAVTNDYVTHDVIVASLFNIKQRQETKNISVQNNKIRLLEMILGSITIKSELVRAYGKDVSGKHYTIWEYKVTKSLKWVSKLYPWFKEYSREVKVTSDDDRELSEDLFWKEEWNKQDYLLTSDEIVSSAKLNYTNQPLKYP